jgi:hypothetical protein
VVPGPGDDNPNIFIPDGPVSLQHVVVAPDRKADSCCHRGTCGSGEVVDQTVFVSTHYDASGKTQLKATGDIINQAIAVAFDAESWTGAAIRVYVDELVLIAPHDDATIHPRDRHVPHSMPAVAFQDDSVE